MHRRFQRHGPVLVTGGAGYIGSHVAQTLVDRGIEVVVLDDLSTGRIEFVPEEASFVEGSVTEAEAVREALVGHEVGSVVHLAALKWAGVSVDEPLRFFHVNVEGTRVLLSEMAAAGVGVLVFSSSCAIYGTPEDGVVTDDSVPDPESPYGQTKLAGEWLAEASSRAHGIRHSSLRYFNVAGSGAPGLFDTSPYNLFPRMLKALTSGERPVVHGADYPTPDGSCIRDYVHVSDIADAHVEVLGRLLAGEHAAPAYNLGSGTGHSVFEVLDIARRVSGVSLDPAIGERRPGDPSRVVAACDRIQAELGWSADRSLELMVESAWREWVRQLERLPAA